MISSIIIQIIHQIPDVFPFAPWVFQHGNNSLVLVIPALWHILSYIILDYHILSSQEFIDYHRLSTILMLAVVPTDWCWPCVGHGISPGWIWNTSRVANSSTFPSFISIKFTMTCLWDILLFHSYIHTYIYMYTCMINQRSVPFGNQTWLAEKKKSPPFRSKWLFPALQRAFGEYPMTIKLFHQNTSLRLLLVFKLDFWLFKS